MTGDGASADVQWGRHVVQALAGEDWGRQAQVCRQPDFSSFSLLPRSSCLSRSSVLCVEPIRASEFFPFFAIDVCLAAAVAKQ